MAKGYTQLTQEQRYHIWALLKTGNTRRAIAEEVGCSPSTIGREIRRNTGERGYRPKQAHRFAEERRNQARAPRKMTPDLRARIEEKILLQWSPEQISGRLKREGVASVSHERIYQHVKEDKEKGGELYKHLRRGHRKRRKRFGVPSRQGQIPNRVSIDQRPSVVDQRSRKGDWEGDTVVGSEHRGALVTVVERKSKYTLIGRVDRSTSEAVTASIECMTRERAVPFKTLTTDNGREFAGHEDLAARTGVSVYFAHPYHSWERGLNENTNGLIRQYFPKGTNFQAVTDDEVERVEGMLNHRPRKNLEYLTPHEVLVEGKHVVVKSKRVALPS